MCHFWNWSCLLNPGVSVGRQCMLKFPKNSCRQESPPAWTQEAYRPPCSKYSLCCPNWVPPPGQGTPPARVPPSQSTPLARVPPSQGTPHQGTPPARVAPPSQGTPPSGPGRVPPPWLPHGILGNVAKHYGIWVPPPGVNWQTKWNYYLPVVLRTRAVKIDYLLFWNFKLSESFFFLIT